MEKYAIKETKELLDLVFVAGLAFKNANSDGQINAADLGHLVPVFVAAGPAFEKIDQVPAEVGDLSQPEAEELLAYAQVKVPQIVDRPKLVNIVNAALGVGVSLVKLVAALKSPEVVQVSGPVS